MKSRMAVLTLAGMALAVVFACRLTADEPARGKPAQQAGPTADEALQLLKDGNARFVADMPKEAERGSKKRIELAQGQRPIAVGRHSEHPVRRSHLRYRHLLRDD